MNNPMTPMSKRATIDPKRLLISATAIALMLGFVPMAEVAIYPIRILVTTLHEAGHAIMALGTGGSVDYVAIQPDGSGVTYSRGGIHLLTSMAGYLGTTLMGAVMLLILRKPSNSKPVLTALGGALILFTLLYVRNAFGFVMGLGLGLAAIGAAIRFSPSASAFLASFLAVQLSLNALFDLRSLWYLSVYTQTHTDAQNMAQFTGLPAWMWSGVWIAAAAVVLFAAVRTFWQTANTEAPHGAV